MSIPGTSQEIEADFAVLLRRGGVSIEPARRPALLESYIRYLDMVRILDLPQTYGQEPATVLHLYPTPESPQE